MEELKVGQVIISEQVEPSENYERFKELVKKKKISVTVLKDNNLNSPQKLKIEKGLYFEILWPDNRKMIFDNALNNNSIVCKLNYKNTSVLFTGDIEKIAENQILETYINNVNLLNSTILKVAHHGSISSSTKDFLDIVKPKIALIGVDKNNKFGHPDKEVINRLEQMRMQNLPNRSNGRNNNKN